MRLNKAVNKSGYTIKHGSTTIKPTNTFFGKLSQLVKTVVTSKIIPINGNATSKVSNYYQALDCGSLLLRNNAISVAYSTFYAKTAVSINKLLSKHKKPVVYRGGEYVDFHPYSK